MRVLVACEFSGIVRDAFLRRGHDAVSCDLRPTESDGPHIQKDVRRVLGDGWDLMIAHPPCTYLAVSGARWFKERKQQQEEALDFVRKLLGAPIHRIALENPVSVISTRIAPPDQIIQPFQFGHIDYKRTCLWLKNLPFLRPTRIVPKGDRQRAVHNAPQTKDRSKIRSVTYTGIAEAMADQWGDIE